MPAPGFHMVDVDADRHNLLALVNHTSLNTRPGGNCRPRAYLTPEAYRRLGRHDDRKRVPANTYNDSGRKNLGDYSLDRIGLRFRFARVDVNVDGADLASLHKAPDAHVITAMDRYSSRFPLFRHARGTDDGDLVRAMASSQNETGAGEGGDDAARKGGAGLVPHSRTAGMDRRDREAKPDEREERQAQPSHGIALLNLLLSSRSVPQNARESSLERVIQIIESV